MNDKELVNSQTSSMPDRISELNENKEVNIENVLTIE